MDQATSGSPRTELTETLMLTELQPLVERIRDIGIGRHRVIIGLVGAPGSGKSTLAAQLVAALAPESAAVVPLDGFHLAAEILAGTELAARRGAIDTFDAGGFRTLIERLRSEVDTVYAPRYTREIEDPIGSAIAIDPEVRYLIVEGNYLLAPSSPWTEAREHMNEVWYLDISPAVRLARLVNRHIQFGKSPADARKWSYGSDEINARVIESSRPNADLVVNVEQMDGGKTVPDRA